mmetsp:Transcript_9648/g.29228  ORF Transcript_9648/g.29228 Transcript_9648/m.29228 type:complete len:264 (-) Transcript_9648:64-855(-)
MARMLRAPIHRGLTPRAPTPRAHMHSHSRLCLRSTRLHRSSTAPRHSTRPRSSRTTRSSTAVTARRSRMTPRKRRPHMRSIMAATRRWRTLRLPASLPQPTAHRTALLAATRRRRTPPLLASRLQLTARRMVPLVATPSRSTAQQLARCSTAQPAPLRPHSTPAAGRRRRSTLRTMPTRSLRTALQGMLGTEAMPHTSTAQLRQRRSSMRIISSTASSMVHTRLRRLRRMRSRPHPATSSPRQLLRRRQPAAATRAAAGTSRS